MRALENHPVVAGVGLILAFLSIVSVAVTVWVFLEAERVRNDFWLEMDKKWNEQLLDKFDELENDHKILLEAFTQAQADINFRMGVHSGRHMEMEHSIP